MLFKILCLLFTLSVSVASRAQAPDQILTQIPTETGAATATQTPADPQVAAPAQTSPQIPGVGQPVPAQNPSDGGYLKLKHPKSQELEAVKSFFLPFGLWYYRQFQDYAGDYKRLLKHHPEAFDIFKLHEANHRPQVDNDLTFVNESNDFEGIGDRRFGYCFGMATLIRNIEVLAFFDPSATAPAEKGSKQWLRFYRRIIKRLASGQATVIPGFKNVHDFSADKQIALELKIMIMTLWDAHAVSWRAFGFALRASRPITLKEQTAFTQNIKERLARHEMPKILFSALVPLEKFLGIETDIHTVNVYDIQDLPNGGSRVFIWDEDLYVDELLKNPAYLDFTPDGKIHYEKWFDPADPSTEFIGRVEIAPENDEETAMQIDSLNQFCKNPKTAKYCSVTSK